MSTATSRSPIAWFREQLRDPNPILVKELRSTLRTPLFVRFLYLATGLVGIIVLMSGAMAAASDQPPASVGQLVFQLFFGTALAVLSLVVPAAASATLTSEHEAMTFESLVMTGMDARRIIIGKFLATMAVFSLVLVSFMPVVGVAFLFGGVSPLRVLWALFGFLLLLAPAVSFGIAISANMRTTRGAIVISTIVFQPFTGFIVSVLSGLSYVAHTDWGYASVGPFWFAEALAEDFFRPEVFVFAFVLPIFLSVMATWFLLQGATAAIKTSAEDRSTPFKWWAVVWVAGQLIFGAALQISVAHGDRDESIAVVIGMAVFVASLIALLFMNEPPLRPRLAAHDKVGLMSRLYGPGAMPTMRLALTVVFALVLSPLVLMVVIPSHLDTEEWLGLTIIMVGCGAVIAAFFCFGVWLRIVMRSGMAARLLSIVLFVGAVLFGALVSAFTTGGRGIPLPLSLSPIGPIALGVEVAGDRSHAQPSFALLVIAIYAAIGLVFFTLCAGAVERARTADETRRADQLRRLEERRREQEARPSVPPETLAAYAAEVLEASDAPVGEGMISAAASQQDASQAVTSEREAGDEHE